MPLFFLLCRWMCCLDVWAWSVEYSDGVCYVFLFLLSIINFSN